MAVLKVLVHPRLMGAFGILSGGAAGLLFFARPLPGDAAEVWLGVYLAAQALLFAASARRGSLARRLTSVPRLGVLLVPFVSLFPLLVPLFGALIANGAPAPWQAILYGVSGASILAWLALCGRMVLRLSDVVITVPSAIRLSALCAAGNVMCLAAFVPSLIMTGLFAHLASLVLFEGVAPSRLPVADVSSFVVATFAETLRLVSPHQFAVLVIVLVLQPLIGAVVLSWVRSDPPPSLTA